MPGTSGPCGLILRALLALLLVSLPAAAMPASAIALFDLGGPVERPGAGAAETRVHSEVHTYFVSGAQGAAGADSPAVLVHNVSLRRLIGRYGAYVKKAKASGRRFMDWAQFRGRHFAQRARALGEAGRPWEGRAGANLELSGRVAGLSRSAHVGAEWVESGTGRSIDLMLGMRIPSRALRQQIAGRHLERQMLRHMGKADVTVVSTRYLRGQNLRDVQAMVQRLQGAVPGKQLWIGNY